VKYLGHEICRGKIKPEEVKILAIKDYATPTTKTEVRVFIGLCNYYRKYIKMSAEFASPITNLTKGRARKGKLEWSEEANTAFEKLKKVLCARPVLMAPDFVSEFIIKTDASENGIGIVLSQKGTDGEEHPVPFLS
jgi:hypothetical protein